MSLGEEWMKSDRMMTVGRELRLLAEPLSMATTSAPPAPSLCALHAPRCAPLRRALPRASATMRQRREWWLFSQSPTQCRFLPVLTFLLLCSFPNPASAGNKLRGIDPQDLDYYKDDTIWCKDGSKSFPRERLNDNFCDCADGTDEPGTSACPNSKYYCKNIGSTPKLVFASQVNDGICDCCDGSDEWEKRVDCANTCGGAIEELSGILEDNLEQSITLDTDVEVEAIPVKQQKKFGEDLVSKLKEMKAVMLVMQWLPLFALLSLLSWMWARVPRRLQLRRKKVSRPSFV